MVADPKDYTKKAQTATRDIDDDDATPESLRAEIASLQAQVTALLQAQNMSAPSGGITEERLEKMLTRVAQITAEAQERAANPSNKVHPHISVYSYPEGDIARRRPDLKCPMFWVGYPIEWDTTTAEEIELLNLAEPGIYTFLRTDGTADELTITGERNPAGKISKLLFHFVTHERRDTLPSTAAQLRSAFKVKTPQEIELALLRSEVDALRQKAPVPA